MADFHHPRTLNPKLSAHLCTVRYLGATNYRPSRWVVEFMGQRVTVSYDYGDNAAIAGAHAGLAKMGRPARTLYSVILPDIKQHMSRREHAFLVVWRDEEPAS